jgi:hypothetical protein
MLQDTARLPVFQIRAVSRPSVLANIGCQYKTPRLAQPGGATVKSISAILREICRTSRQTRKLLRIGTENGAQLVELLVDGLRVS